MKLTKHEAEFLFVALQWAAQDRQTLADAYWGSGADTKEGKRALRDRARCLKFLNKIRTWLVQNKGKVLLTATSWLSEQKDLKTIGLDELRRLKEPT